MTALSALWAALCFALGLAAVCAAAALASRRGYVALWAGAFALVALRAALGLADARFGPSLALALPGLAAAPLATALFAAGTLGLVGRRTRPRAWALLGALAALGFLGSLFSPPDPWRFFLPLELAASWLALDAARAVFARNRLLAAGAALTAARPLAHLLLAFGAARSPAWLYPAFLLWLVPAVGVVHALTSFLRAETARERAKARDLLEIATEAALFVVEPSTGRLLEANQRARELFGEEFGGRSDLWALAPPGQGDALRRRVEGAMDEPPARLDAVWAGAGGKPLRARLLAAESVWEDRAVWLVFLLEEAGKGGEARRRLDELAAEAVFAAHDVKNVFQVILSCAEGLQRKGQADAEAVRPIVDAARAGGGLARKLLDPAPTTAAAATDPAALAARVAAAFRSSLPASITLAFEADADLPDLLADAGEVERALLNLLGNARDAVDRRGRIALYARGRGRRGGAKPASVLFSVEDSGPGVDPSLAARLGEPLVTTKAPGKGTGLGLAQARAVAERFGGDLTWGRAAGGGARFELLLPSAPREDLPAILLIDADDRCRAELDHALKLAGREVRTAADGERGLELLARRGERIGFVALDLVLPGMGGRKLLERLAAAHPHVRVLVHSSASGDAAREGALALGAGHFVATPAPAAALRRWILTDDGPL